MKILIKEKPSDWDSWDSIDNFESSAYTLRCVLKSDDSMTAIQVCKMLFKAMEIEGYHPQSIAQAMHDYAEYEAYQMNYKFRDTDNESSFDCCEPVEEED